MGDQKRFAATALVLFVVTACHRKPRSPLERGAADFQRTCAPCHGPDARGTHPPGFTTPPKNLTDPALQDRLTDAQIRETIRYGKGQMPPFGMALSEQEVNDLLLYVRTLRSSTPTPVTQP
jgi:mono/diheme cytochrome c family protein